MGRIVGIYGELAELTPSPVVELNRAVALAMLFGPEAGLKIVDALKSNAALKTSPLAERTWGPAQKTWASRRGARGIRARRRPYAE
jgi:predicted RNA polymerase sigma factor